MTGDSCCGLSLNGMPTGSGCGWALGVTRSPSTASPRRVVQTAERLSRPTQGQAAIVPGGPCDSCGRHGYLTMIKTRIGTTMKISDRDNDRDNDSINITLCGI
jgi:hypothetical protein